jgi:cytochrome b pre-mRNA-processing protein 3
VIFSSARHCAKVAADIAYQRVVEQAPQPIFFADYGVPDTLHGRFELICVHAFLYLHRLKAERPRASRLCQGFFDRMFADFDRSLREMGVGDLSIGKHVKRMARAFYGRIVAYDEGLASGTELLGAAISRKVFGTVVGPACAVDEMASYIWDTAEKLRRQLAAELLAGRVAFTPRGSPTRAPLPLSG